MEMKPYQNIFVLVLFLVAFASNVVVMHGQTICKMSAQELMSCKPAVTPPEPSDPSSACCAALKHADVACLCSFKSSSWLPSLGIDPNLATQLPEKCKLPHPANC
ncbi:unnamed protein product [Coffea canephora]|uniref:Bifunctional inhibitor/plant lipid transfer protein/seed storage helical domain-containing protein n=1 Tax=Coffea canephora TaxID=49390 RepID=A0A068TR77_COFCA|nr:unnamed protein product [Coffea canephora]